MKSILLGTFCLISSLQIFLLNMLISGLILVEKRPKPAKELVLEFIFITLPLIINMVCSLRIGMKLMVGKE